MEKAIKAPYTISDYNYIVGDPSLRITIRLLTEKTNKNSETSSMIGKYILNTLIDPDESIENGFEDKTAKKVARTNIKGVEVEREIEYDSGADTAFKLGGYVFRLPREGAKNKIFKDFYSDFGKRYSWVT